MTKSHQHKDTYYIDKRTTIRVFKTFKRNPEKTFVATDFFKSNARCMARKHIGLLIALGLIEKVDAIWMAGQNYRARRYAQGYRLKELNNVFVLENE